MGVSRRVVSRVLCLGLAMAGMPLAASGGEIVACKMSAWTTDRDPDGLNIRSGPGTAHPVVATLPPPAPVETGGDDYAAQVVITGSQDGWFRITDAFWGGPSVGDDEPLFEGEGWVSGRYLGLAVEGRHLYSEPSYDADEVVDLFDGGDDYVVMDRLHACDGHWAEGEVAVRGRTFRGWASDICSSQLTTCP